jgi:hypothetical protein
MIVTGDNYLSRCVGIRTDGAAASTGHKKAIHTEVRKFAAQINLHITLFSDT